MNNAALLTSIAEGLLAALDEVVGAFPVEAIADIATRVFGILVDKMGPGWVKANIDYYEANLKVADEAARVKFGNDQIMPYRSLVVIDTAEDPVGWALSKFELAEANLEARTVSIQTLLKKPGGGE